MSARRATPQSGTKDLADLKAGDDSVVHQLRHRIWSPNQTPEERPAARRTDPPASRRSSSFTAPLRESFFDLAQRYQRLRESAFMSKSSRQKKASTLRLPVAPAAREPRLADLPPPPPLAHEVAPRPAYLDSYIEENTEEATLVQPLARRASDPPPPEPRRHATVRPPPPPDPLPRAMPDPLPRILPSSMPPAVAMATIPPQRPPGPLLTLWRPMLATAVVSATIGAVVSVGLWAVRTSPPAPPLRPTIIATAAPKDTTTPAGTAPCPLPSTYAGATPQATNASRSTLGASAPQVSLDNLPVEVTSPRGQSAPLLRAPAPRAAVVSHAVATRSVAAAAPRASDDERPSKRSRKAKAESENENESSGEDEELQARMGAPAPPPTPTAGPNKAAIAKSVARATAAATSCDAGPQSGRAQITFAPSGNVSNVSLIQPFSDNAVNGCVLRALGRAHIPPFVGDPVSVRKGLSW
jgi:hypothetical protein